MPYDAKGKPLVAGDSVMIPARISFISSDEGYCNCTVVLDHPMPPDNTQTTLHQLNTKQVEKK